MFSWREFTLLLALFAAGLAGAQTDRYPGIGRSATASEIAAWDIDVRPDFKGLPAGAGSVAKGMKVWEAQCASCHGFFGESNQFFSPIVGGTTPDDIATGRVARLNDPSFPGRTTLMKLPTLSTLWDYIRRAMPWTQPKSLSDEEVYAVTAYILNLGGVVPDDFVLSDKNITEVQQRLPNRNGMSTDHALWPGSRPRQPDVRATACMNACARVAKVASFLPDHARDAHGNLAEQNRGVGAQKGADTRRSTRPAP
jgi:S-disulfanyl-L-cysteine oxidoreductase SoxD